MSRAPEEPIDFDAELAMATAARDTGDFAHASSHVAWALAARPRASEALALADSLMDAADDPLGLAPMQDDNSFAIMALRARVLARVGRFTDALELLLEVVAVKPDVSYWPWAIGWARDSGARIDANVAAGAVLRLVSRLGEYATVLLPSLVELVRALRVHHAESPALAATLVRLLRQSGNLDEALALAEQAYARNRIPDLAVILATTHREREEFDRAIAMLREALELDPKLTPAWLDIGDIFLEAGDFAAAADAYEHALEIDPNTSWAKASQLYARHRDTDDRRHLHELEDFVEAHPEDDRARSLLEEITPYVGYVPDPNESSIRALVDLLNHIESGVDLPESPQWTFRVSVLEAPSVRLVADQFLAVVLPKGRIAFEIAAVPSPDPRVPRAPVDWVLWSYEGTEPHPGLSPPSAGLLAPVVALASQDFSASTWHEEARNIARSFRPEDAPAILAQMVHPPIRGEDLPPWRWIPRLQLACAYVLAHLESGWNGSWRQRALLSLLDGPVDWVAAAGIAALAEIARAEPTHREPIRTLLQGLLDTGRPSAGYWCLEAPLVFALLRIPGATNEQRARLRERSLSV